MTDATPDVDDPIPFTVTVKATLPPQQANVLAFIRSYWHDQQRPPSTRDIVRAFGFSGPNAAVVHLEALSKKGLIEWPRTNTARSIWPAGLRDVIRRALETGSEV